MWASWMDIAFAKLDANGDGYISLEELLARLPDAVDGPAAAVEGERLNAARPSHICCQTGRMRQLRPALPRIPHSSADGRSWQPRRACPVRRTATQRLAGACRRWASHRL